MGISMLGGLVQTIISGFTSLLTNIFSWVIGLLIKWIVFPVLELIIAFIQNILCYFLYMIATFLLGLVDFVEVLFRLLAGLDTHGVAELQYNGKSGDVLIQLITSEEVTQAFLAMCIVGLFLLVITTIFQMIKVEYTTEGSKNAKGPILEKAFKGVANLMLLPLLVVFGIFIGNQILDLIDTATSGSNTASISGLLFVTAAGDAVWQNGDVKLVFDENNKANYISTILDYSIETAWDSEYEDEDESKTDSSTKTATEINSDVINNSFMNNSDGYTYFNLYQVSEFYDITKINYAVLIFATCIVIKTLYHAAFGMVSRLYYCVALYIVSPMVIGVSPVMEKSFSSWRSKFLGKVISAYGVVISLNIFFIVIRLLLNIDIRFVNFTGPFTNHLMTCLIKAIFVIAGSLLIEKLSGDFAGFFGGEDALSTGKTLSKEVGDTATKAITTVATGAAIVGTGGAAALRGLGKVGHGIADGVKNAGPNASKGQKFVGGLMGAGSTIGKGAWSAAKSLGGKVAEAGQAAADYAGVGNLFDKAIHKHSNKKHLAELNAAKTNTDLQSADPTIRDAAEKRRDAAQAIVDKDNEKANLRRSQRVVRESSRDYIAKQGINKMKPKFMNELTKMKADGEQKGTEYSDEGKSAYSTVKKADGDKVKEKYNAKFEGIFRANKAYAGYMQNRNNAGKYMNQENEAKDKELKAIQDLTEAIRRATNFQDRKTLEAARDEQIKAYNQNYSSPVRFDNSGNVDKMASGWQTKTDLDMHITEIYNVANDAMNKGLSGDAATKYIKAQLENLVRANTITQESFESYKRVIDRIMKEAEAKKAQK